MPIITSVKLQHFKAVEDIQLTNLKRINYLIGANGSGKSSIFEAVAIVGKMTRENSLHFDSPFFGDAYRVIRGNTELKITTTIDQSNDIVQVYSASIRSSRHDQLEVSQQNFAAFKQRSDSNFSFANQSGVDEQGWSSFILDASATDEEVNSTLKHRYSFDLESIEAVTPLKDFLNTHYVKGGEHVRNIFRSTTSSAVIELEIVSKENLGKHLRFEGLKAISSGYRQLISIYFSIVQQVKYFQEIMRSFGRGGYPLLICIEEPGVALHPKLQKAIPPCSSK